MGGAASMNDEKQLEYGLRFALCSSSAHITGSRSLCTDAALADFSRKWAGHLTIDAYVEKAELGSNNTIQDLLDRGVQIPAQGFMIHTGLIPRPADASEYVLVKAAVGRSFCTEDESARSENAASLIPEGYDSVCFPGEAERTRLQQILEKDAAAEENTDPEAAGTDTSLTESAPNNFKYLITDPRLMLPVSWILFEPSDSSQLLQGGSGDPVADAAFAQAISALEGVAGGEAAIQLLRSQHIA